MEPALYMHLSDPEVAVLDPPRGLPLYHADRAAADLRGHVNVAPVPPREDG
ncbi:MAG TPA: hypothetical protein VJR25_16030 [Microbacterium sp.]|uniref:hypothetical protein n=1 Tax=Microbacterium sp. TaxID=51671 RepID=UPI002B4A7EE0|nr:hypothetical protein [Microbacterium sp.]HKT58271.1 hypothetical protein [Microbacterium sp.]